jgi:transcriptional regulator with XRE-family HTH domain
MKLVEVRRLRLLSLQQLSRKAGVSVKTINKIELGQTKPALSTIQKLCMALDVEPVEVDEFRDAIFRANISGKELALAST